MSEKSNIERRTISSAVIDAMRASGWLRSDGYSLKEGFTGVYTIEDVVETKTRASKELNNFTLHCNGAGRKIIMPGSILANSRIVSSADFTAKSVKDATDVFFSEEVEEVIADSVIFNEGEQMDEDYVFPASFKIVGAVVNKNEDTDKPTMPLRKYKHYNQVLRHHRKVTEDKDAFITKDLFKEYLEGGEVAGVTDSELSVVSSVNEDDMKHWNFTLLVADLSKDE